MKSKLPLLRITLTGGAKSGKTTIMKAIGKALGVYSLSTGDMFRTHAWVWANSKLDLLDIAGREKELKNAYIYLGDNHNYFYKKINITEDIDTNEMSSITCQLAQIPWFRKIVKDKIAKIIKNHRQIIVEGRDTGSKILPEAEIKIFLNHDYNSRVRNISGSHEDKESLKELLIWRDEQDAKRGLDPFVKPTGAFEFNNSYITKKAASSLMLQKIILPELERLNISTNNFNPKYRTSEATVEALGLKEEKHLDAKAKKSAIHKAKASKAREERKAKEAKKAAKKAKTIAKATAAKKTPTSTRRPQVRKTPAAPKFNTVIPANYTNPSQQPYAQNNFTIPPPPPFNSIYSNPQNNNNNGGNNSNNGGF